MNSSKNILILNTIIEYNLSKEWFNAPLCEQVKHTITSHNYSNDSLFNNTRHSLNFLFTNFIVSAI